jgi:hypothetical protein
MTFSKLRPRLSLVAFCVISGLCLAFLTTSSNGESQKSDTADGSEKADEAEDKLTVPEARRQTKLLHDTYIATLHTVHRSYFDEDEREIIPARALEEVFRQVDAETGGKTRWISVNTPAMNIDHKPKEGFEKDAARELAKGEREFERVEKGTYFRAGAVSLFASCTKCHLSGLRPQQKVRSVAGLVISLPVEEAGGE